MVSFMDLPVWTYVLRILMIYVTYFVRLSFYDDLILIFTTGNINIFVVI